MRDTYRMDMEMESLRKRLEPYRMDREMELLRKRLEVLEKQKREEEEKEKQKRQSIDYNLNVIQEAASKMKEQGERYTDKYSPYKHVCKDYSEAFEAIYNSLRLINEQLNPPKATEVNTTAIKL